MKIALSQIREEYISPSLTQIDMEVNPVVQFGKWFDMAVAADIYEPNAMTLATCTAAGEPSARMVLLKDFDERGFTFFSNYESRKGGELAENGRAALVFWWGILARQIRIEGRVEKIDPAESDAYFQSRSRGSQLGALISPQSQVLSNGRAELLARLSEAELRFSKAMEISRPDYWGGYRVIPHRFEFWQGQPNRLHNRFCYLIQPDGSWQIDRLAP